MSSQEIITSDQVGQMLQLYAHIFQHLGFLGHSSLSPQDGREIVFDKDIHIGGNGFSLSIVDLKRNSQLKSRTFNFEGRQLMTDSSLARIQDREVKTVNVQLIESADSKVLSLRVFFRQPLNYASEDLVFRVTVESSAGQFRLKQGFPWLPPELHMPPATALDLTTQLSRHFPDAV